MQDVAHTIPCMAKCDYGMSVTDPLLATCYICMFSRFSELGALSLAIAGCLYLYQQHSACMLSICFALNMFCKSTADLTFKSTSMPPIRMNDALRASDLDVWGAYPAQSYYAYTDTLTIMSKEQPCTI